MEFSLGLWIVLETGFLLYLEGGEYRIMFYSILLSILL